MATTRAFDAERLLELVEDAIGEAGVHVADSLLGATSTPKKHKSARTHMESVNTLQYRNQDVSRMEDTVTVELWFQLRPSGQRATRAASAVTARLVRNRITRINNIQLRPGNPVHLSTDPEVRGEWYTITDRFRFQRDEEVGREG
jgi:hypothetical protein